MKNKQHIECVDRSLRNIWKVGKPCGGILFVFGGDPCQILRVVHHGDHPKITKACVKSSHLWNHVHIWLIENTRVDPGEERFSNYLLSIVEGTAEVLPDIGDLVINVPVEFLVESVLQLVEKVFLELQDGYGGKY